MKPRALIVDVDGTLASTQWRTYVLHDDIGMETVDDDLEAEQDARWDRFFALGDRDQPVQGVVEVVALAKQSGLVILALTGRPDRLRKGTAKWLRRHKIRVDALFMREDDDRRSSAEFKEERIVSKILPHYDVAMALDDDRDVTQVYEKLKIPILMVRDPCLHPEPDDTSTAADTAS